MDNITLNSPLNVEVKIAVAQNSTTVSMDVLLHPKDVENLREKIFDMCNNELDETKRFVKDFNEMQSAIFVNKKAKVNCVHCYDTAVNAYDLPCHFCNW